MMQDILPSLPELDGTGLSLGIVVARYNWHITGAMLRLAQAELHCLGVADQDIQVAFVPGSFELSTMAQAMLGVGSYDALICFSCVIKGETRHDILVTDAAAQGIIRVSLDAGVPVIFGVMCTENQQQAEDRIRRGVECAQAAVEMARMIRTLKEAGKEGR